MKFDKHVFISYAHLDNQPLTPDQMGWVSLFHATLQTMLSQRLGAKAEIWRDDKLRGNDVFADEILDQFPKTALLVSVLTPRYLNSEWCTREIREFCRIAQEAGGVTVDNKSRVFKVIKMPVEGEASLPPVIGQVLGYEFYEYDEDKTPHELDPAYGDKERQDFLRKTNKLAWDIAQLLRKLSEASPAQMPPAGDSAAKPVIYLAQCSRDRREAREIVEGELKRLGYRVLPEHPLPNDEQEYVAEVQRVLAQCALSIHLIGAGYGLVPDGPSQKSVVVLQNELAVERSRSDGLRRVIWLPEGVRGEQPAQQAFVDALNRDAGLQFGADLITGDLETLKAAVHGALAKLEQAARAQPPATGETDAKRVFVVCTEKDRKDMLPLLKALKARGLEVKVPLFSGDATDVREANQSLIVAADAILLYYGAGDEAWRFHHENEIKKMGGFARKRPLLARYTVLADPPTDDKEMMLNLEEPNLINALGGFSESALDAFLSSVGVR